MIEVRSTKRHVTSVRYLHATSFANRPKVRDFASALTAGLAIENALGSPPDLLRTISGECVIVCRGELHSACFSSLFTKELFLSSVEVAYL